MKTTYLVNSQPIGQREVQIYKGNDIKKAQQMVTEQNNRYGSDTAWIETYCD